MSGLTRRARPCNQIIMYFQPHCRWLVSTATTRSWLFNKQLRKCQRQGPPVTRSLNLRAVIADGAQVKVARRESWPAYYSWSSASDTRETRPGLLRVDAPFEEEENRRVLNRPAVTVRRISVTSVPDICRCPCLHLITDGALPATLQQHQLLVSTISMPSSSLLHAQASGAPHSPRSTIIQGTQALVGPYLSTGCLPVRTAGIHTMKGIKGN